MKLVCISILLCATIYVVCGLKLLVSSSRQLNRRETKLVKRLVKRQALSDSKCDRSNCKTPNCGKDFVAAALPGECCEKCVPWEYASSLGIQYPQAPLQPVYDPRTQQGYPYNQYPYNQPSQNQPPQYQPPQNQPPQYQPQRVDVYIFGPDDGARASTGQNVYFDCEVVSPYNQYTQPRWSRSGNQPLQYKVQSTILPGNRKLARITIPDATHSDAGRYECNAGTGNPNDQASIDLQVTDGGYYPRSQPQPQPQPQPQYPQYDPYNQYPYNQPGYYPPQPQPQPVPQPSANDAGEGEGEYGGNDSNQEEPATETTTITTTTQKPTTTPVAPQEEPAEGYEDEGEYPDDYSENEN